MLLKLALFAVLFLEVKLYPEAHKEYVDQNKPMLVYIGAEWCTYCGPFKEKLREKFANRKNLVYTELDVDKDKITQQMVSGDKVPQTIIYYWENKQPKRTIFIGANYILQIEKFLERFKKD